jgi:glucose uptake protein GlcU
MLAIALLIVGIEMISLGARGNKKGEEDSIVSNSRFT